MKSTGIWVWLSDSLNRASIHYLTVEKSLLYVYRKQNVVIKPQWEAKTWILFPKYSVASSGIHLEALGIRRRHLKQFVLLLSGQTTEQLFLSISDDSLLLFLSPSRLIPLIIINDPKPFKFQGWCMHNWKHITGTNFSKQDIPVETITYVKFIF